MQNQYDYQSLYQSLLNNKSLIPLGTLHIKFPKQVYPTAISYPQFFQRNLVSSGRIIKVLTGSNAILKGFYYQYLKLCFEIDIDQKDYIQIFKSVIFDPIINAQQQSGPISGKQYNNIQYKRIIAQFIQMMTAQSIPNFQMAINSYPIVNQALQKIFVNLIINSKQKLLTNLDILRFLGEIFDINVNLYGNCYKFQQSDVFIYQQNPFQLYMAFMSDMGQVSQQSSNSQIQTISQLDNIQQKNNNRYNYQMHSHSQSQNLQQKQQGIINKFNQNQSKISSDPYSKSIQRKTFGGLLGINHLNSQIKQYQSSSMAEKQQPINNPYQFYYGGYNITQQRLKQPQKISLSLFKTQIQKKLPQQVNPIKINNEQQLIYRPKKVSNVTDFNKQVINHTMNGYGKNDKDDTKGTFYRQFTSTQILELVKQPFKSKISIIKNRFIGVRSQKFKGF